MFQSKWWYHGKVCYSTWYSISARDTIMNNYIEHFPQLTNSHIFILFLFFCMCMDFATKQRYRMDQLMDPSWCPCACTCVDKCLGQVLVAVPINCTNYYRAI